jgi:hypothetical protein
MELTNIETKATSETQQDEWLEEIMNEYGDRNIHRDLCSLSYEVLLKRPKAMLFMP